MFYNQMRQIQIIQNQKATHYGKADVSSVNKQNQELGQFLTPAVIAGAQEALQNQRKANIETRHGL